MIVTEVPFQLTERRSADRSGGVHVSNVIRGIALESGVLKPEYARDDDSISEDSGTGLQVLPERIAAGLAFEDWISKQHPEVCYHPGELRLDGIGMSPDGIGYEEIPVELVSGTRMLEVPVIHEFKFTWKSANRDVADEWMWTSQMKAYTMGVRPLIGAQLAFVKQFGWWPAYLHVFWVNGNYRDSGPMYKIYKFEFTQVEIEENWQMIQRYRDKMQGKPVQPPPKPRVINFATRRTK